MPEMRRPPLASRPMSPAVLPSARSLHWKRPPRLLPMLVHKSRLEDESVTRPIFDMAARPVTVSGIPTSDYPTPARRPLNSRLDCAETETVFVIKRPDWRAGLKAVLNDLGVLSA